MTWQKLVERLTTLSFIFGLVAVVETFYGLTALLIPPGQVTPLTGWVLSADGQWITKLLGVALLSQASVAWSLRHNPLLPVAWALAFYQAGSATVDWILWLGLREDGIFANTGARVGILLAIPTHYLLASLLIIAIRKTTAPVEHTP
jgi:hypothetical protein